MNSIGFAFKNYKSFGNQEAKIDEIKNINVFIGRNNCGKSSCLDIVENIISPEVLKNNPFYNIGLEISFDFTPNIDDIKSVFKENYGGGDLPGNHFEFGKNYIDKQMKFSLSVTSAIGNKSTFTLNNISNPDVFDKKYNEYWNGLGKRLNYTWKTYNYLRLDAERNILPEKENDNEIIDSHGSGATNLIRKFLNYSNYDEKIIEETLLTELNHIVYPDAQYNSLKIQQINDENELKWEVFFQEGANRYALSKMGSGLKTILLVLLYLLVLPKTPAFKDKKIVYAFEELENNLHPALQRRLFDYIYDYSTRNDILIFLTTHSHVAINSFCDKTEAQLFHIEKTNNNSSLKKVDDYISKSILLNDLDVRASDILQSNGIIWVEGPSDRIYIKRWMEIFCDEKFIEGKDYQFLYYGGRLLSHYTTKEDEDNLINILTTNRHAAIVIDSDKRHRSASINDTKKRIKNEFSKIDGFCWITKGKEIENYLPKDAISKLVKKM